MRTFDLTPLFRSTVGFDRMTSMLDAATRLDEAPSYPPYNIEKISDNDYRVTMAVAGFSEDDLEITVENQSLTVRGRIEKDDEGDEAQFLHRGIATRAFERRFQLADHILVENALIENGLLHVELRREVPEALKPRTISIGSQKAVKSKSGVKPKVIESKAA